MENSEDSGLLRRKPKKESFQKFLWNSDKKEFCGRTGTSWAKIGVFYLVYYTCLALFFAALLAVFYQTLDTENTPKYSYGESILENPALGFRPRPPKKNIESTLIWYENSNLNSSKHWVKELDDFVRGYEEKGARNCTFSQDPSRLTEEEKKIPCRVKDTFTTRMNSRSLCNSESKWGYTRRSPCILLKLNKIVGWEPDCYKNVNELPEDIPKQLKKHIMTQANKKTGGLPPMAWVSCEGEYPSDKEHLPNVLMFPYWGFPAYYFPYSKNSLYRAPLVAVEFANLKAHVLINIECKIWTKNIKHDRQHRLGMVHLEILSD